MNNSAEDVAAWMFGELRNAGILYQAAAIEHIKTHFGERFVYVNENGNASIDKEVKKAFKKLHGGKAAWDRDAFYWGWTSAIKL
ncbi:hypothetical protein J4772_30645 [Cohnella sp. LGH]|uniref:Integron gene cassette protein n=1 Tax=Cohnella phaseoli TaxID=456490 RepID=A0A3D9HZF8_9BACL|nr:MULTISPECIES: hypothetical protein [Cohnella]QTH41835.1 hypothetical protein J4772_30645 [Cohnella sp. LGH]RED54902.1 hypothetical protein DFP98_14647 [Cohnella phaseoli]